MDSQWLLSWSATKNGGDKLPTNCLEPADWTVQNIIALEWFFVGICFGAPTDLEYTPQKIQSPIIHVNLYISPKDP